MLRPQGAKKRPAKAVPRPVRRGKLARLARMTSPPLPGVPGLAAGLKSNLKSAVLLPTASLRICIRLVAVLAVRRSAESLALGPVLGAALGFPSKIGVALAAADFAEEEDATGAAGDD